MQVASLDFNMYMGGVLVYKISILQISHTVNLMASPKMHMVHVHKLPQECT